MIRIGITCGDINGIGPEIIIKAIKTIQSDFKFYLIGPKNIFLNSISKYKLEDFSKFEFVDLGKYSQAFGNPTSISGKVALNAINTSLKLWNEKVIDLIVTAPISKEAIYKAGSKFPGHTEIFADHFHTNDFMMMFLSRNLFAGLITIHEPIKEISKIISKNLLERKFAVLKKSLEIDFRKKSPKIAVLGLNPHAGENGIIGKEEESLIEPTVKKLNSNKNIFTGPFSADGFFGQKLYKKYDCTLGLYHDQVLIPFKLLSFNEGINFTAGLPLVRTSPDHGTAFNLAGKNLANPKSMIEAIKYGVKIFKNRSNKE